jgi:hypothetical protein
MVMVAVCMGPAVPDARLAEVLTKIAGDYKRLQAQVGSLDEPSRLDFPSVPCSPASWPPITQIACGPWSWLAPRGVLDPTIPTWRHNTF